MKQEDMFGLPPKPPRNAPRRLMRVVDEADFPEGYEVAKFECPRCGYATGWEYTGGNSGMRRGYACPRCNPTHTIRFIRQEIPK